MKSTLLPAVFMTIGIIIMISNKFSWRVPQESTNFLGGAALVFGGIAIYGMLKARKTSKAVA